MGSPLALVALIACGEPTTLEGCTGLVREGDRAECYVRLLEPMVDEKGNFEEAMDSIPPSMEKDQALHMLAVRHPNRAPLICPRSSTVQFKEMCQQVLGRPHLYRENR